MATNDELDNGPAVCENAAFGRCSGEVTFDADPFDQEINGDDTPHWLCEECRYQHAMDI